METHHERSFALQGKKHAGKWSALLQASVLARRSLAAGMRTNRKRSGLQNRRRIR
ncbi:MAG: hypothetical protein JJT88_20535 [Gammaproteobacteria bacterium]|nr:hypothetical protein [Gammaproteobacteria bacterium]